MIPYAQPCIDEEDIKSVVKSLNSGWISFGQEATAFEKEICEYIGTKYCLTTNCATSGLHLALKVLNLPEGSEVITTPFTFLATINSIIYNNLIPRFVDIKPDTRNLDYRLIIPKINSNTRAILAVDFGGTPSYYDELQEICNDYNLYLIADSSHSIGAKYNNELIGNQADITIFCFNAIKQMTTGEGGAIVFNKSDWYDRLYALRNWGIDTLAKDRIDWSYDMKELGYKYLMTDFQAALGRSQLKKLNAFTKRRKEIAKIYDDEFYDLNHISIQHHNYDNVYHLYTLLISKQFRRKFYSELRNVGIGANVHYKPAYRFTYYRNLLNVRPRDYYVTESIYNKILTLPLHPCLTNAEVEYVIDNFKMIHKKIIN